MQPWAIAFCGRITTPFVAKIEALGHDMWESGQEKGLWANQSAETWHDNFGYEQEQQHQWALSERAEDLVQIKNEAEIVERRVVGEVDIGAQVTIEDAETGERKSFVVGSYQVLDQQHDDEISYAAPLARPFMGATAGEEREVTIGDRTTLFRLVCIE
jgi:transcription elongation GreA/GreB family factor